MNYPIRILPNKHYKFIDCDLSSQFLVRYTNTNRTEEIIEANTGFVNQKHICDPSSNMNDLSTSLLGRFKLSHNKIELTEVGKQKYSVECKPDCIVQVPKLKVDFNRNENRGFWVLKIKDINGTIVDYTKANLPFTAICTIQHTPMKWNFWHFSIRWRTTDQGFWHQLDKKDRDKLSKRLAHETRAHIAKFAKINKPTYQELHPKYYFKKPPCIKIITYYLKESLKS